jgi:hypothetical protein
LLFDEEGDNLITWTLILCFGSHLVSQNAMGRNKDTTTTIETRALRLEFDGASQRWSLFEKRGEENAPLIQSAFAQLLLEDGTILRTDDRSGSVKTSRKSFSDFGGKGKSLRIITTQRSVELSLDLRLYEGERRISVQLDLFNKSGNLLRAKELESLVTSETGGVFLRSDRIILNKNGYHSWSESEIFELDTSTQKSFWHTILSAPSSSQSVLLGFVTNERAVNAVVIHRRTQSELVQATAVSELNSFEIKNRKRFSSDRLLIQFEESPLVNAQKYSELLYRFSLRQRKGTYDQRNPWRKVPTGWCSYYNLYSKVSERNVVANLDACSEHFINKGLRYIQLDDGYQRAAGDWDMNEKFPHGHRWLTHEIHRKGFLAGLWIAPFAVTAKSALYNDHPDWVLKNPDGSPVKAGSIEDWGGDVYMLDPTMPPVEKWLTDLFRKITRKWRYDYVKIDFLYMGAHAPRYSQAVSPGMAYRMGLEAIRKGVGTKRFILGCGAPIGLSVGFVDGMRIGPDVGTTWTGVLPAAAATAIRYFYHNNVWFNDPDCLVVREPLTLDQARVWASIVGISGQMNLLSDDLPEVPPDRISLLGKTLPVYETGAVPVDLFEPEDETGLMMRNEEGRDFRLARLLSFTTGDSMTWKEPDFDDSSWEMVQVPLHWEEYDGHEDYDGYGWYRLRFHLPPEWQPSDLTLSLGLIDDCDETYVNGKMVGSTGRMPPEYQSAWNLFRVYRIPKDAVNWKGENVLAVRAYDGGGPGGLYSLRKVHLPKIWNLRVKKKFGEWNVVGLFNWESFSQEISLDFRKVDLLGEEKYLVYELWDDEFLGKFRDQVGIHLKPTSSKVLAIHRVEDRPVLLSTSRHITHGAIDLRELKWDKKKLTLVGRSINLVRGDYVLTVWVPEGYRFVKAITAVKYEAVEISPSIVRVTLKLGKNKPLDWKLQFERSDK